MRGVDAPVAEADLDAWVAEAATSALAARGALDPAGGALHITVTEAAWLPTRRSDEAVLYEAKLTLRVTAGAREATRTRTWSAAEPGNAAGARALREDTFRMLARLAADDAIAWVLAP